MNLYCRRCKKKLMAQFENPVEIIYGKPYCPRCADKISVIKFTIKIPSKGGQDASNSNQEEERCVSGTHA